MNQSLLVQWDEFRNATVRWKAKNEKNARSRRKIFTTLSASARRKSRSESRKPKTAWIRLGDEAHRWPELPSDQVKQAGYVAQEVKNDTMKTGGFAASSSTSGIL